MGIRLFLIILAVIVLASWQNQVNVKYLNDDHEKWKKKNRK